MTLASSSRSSNVLVFICSFNLWVLLLALSLLQCVFVSQRGIEGNQVERSVLKLIQLCGEHKPVEKFFTSSVQATDVLDNKH